MQSFSRRMESKLNKTTELKQATISTFLVDNNRVHSVILDMNNTDPLKTSFKFKQYDYGTCFVSIQLIDEDVPIDISGKTILGTFRDSSGSIFLDENNAPISSMANVLLLDDGVINMPIPKKVLQKTGNIDCEIVVFDYSGSRMTSPLFSFYIEPSMYNHEDYNPPVSKSPICGEAICGEAICGSDSDTYVEEYFETKTNLCNDFLNRF